MDVWCAHYVVQALEVALSECVCVCVCVLNQDAWPFSMLEATFYGHKYTSQVPIWQSQGIA
jgi:hypothetical protein